MFRLFISVLEKTKLFWCKEARNVLILVLRSSGLKTSACDCICLIVIWHRHFTPCFLLGFGT